MLKECQNVLIPQKNDSSSNILIALPKIIYTESSVCINEKIPVSNDVNE